MFELLAHYAEWIVGVGAGAALLAVVGRKIRNRILATTRKANLAFETLLGRDEIRHPETGDVVVEATPNLGMRFARMEDAIVKMSDTTDAVKALTQRVDVIGSTLATHMNDSNSRETARVEEQTAMWEAIKAVANSAPADTTTVTTTTHN